MFARDQPERVRQMQMMSYLGQQNAEMELYNRQQREVVDTEENTAAAAPGLTDTSTDVTTSSERQSNASSDGTGTNHHHHQQQQQAEGDNATQHNAALNSYNIQNVVANAGSNNISQLQQSLLRQAALQQQQQNQQALRQQQQQQQLQAQLQQFVVQQQQNQQGSFSNMTQNLSYPSFPSLLQQSQGGYSEQSQQQLANFQEAFQQLLHAQLRTGGIQQAAGGDAAAQQSAKQQQSEKETLSPSMKSKKNWCVRFILMANHSRFGFYTIEYIEHIEHTRRIHWIFVHR